MQRLLLAVVILAALLACLRWGYLRLSEATGAGPLNQNRSLPVPSRPQGTGSMAKLAYAGLFLLILCTSAGWLEGL